MKLAAFPALLLALLAAGSCRNGNPTAKSAPATRPGFTYDSGGIIRGPLDQRDISLVFTAGEHGDGIEHILNVLGKSGVPGGFFVTGDYLRQPANHPLLRRMVAQGHYLGPHSDGHLLYAPWDDRKRSLVTEEQFKADLRKNIEDVRAFGALRGRIFFMPPYEWYNADQARWSAEMGVTLFNMSPGSGSNRDFRSESDPKFVSSRRIYDDILTFERNSPGGMNGFILFIHGGVDRKDKLYLMLEDLIGELRGRGYRFVRIDQLLRGA